MLRITIQSFWLPMRHTITICQIFWPVFVTAIILPILIILARHSGEINVTMSLANFFIEFALMLLILQMFLSGIINWHWLLIRGTIKRARLLISKKELAYLHSFLFSLLFQRTLLNLPAIADDNEDFQKTRNAVNSFSYVISILLIAVFYAVIFLLSFMVLSVTALSPEKFPNALESLGIMAVSGIVMLLSIFYGTLSLTTLLSLVYLKHIQPGQEYS